MLASVGPAPVRSKQASADATRGRSAKVSMLSEGKRIARRFGGERRRLCPDLEVSHARPSLRCWRRRRRRVGERRLFRAAHVYDRADMSLCAEYHAHIDPDLFGNELAMLGKVYNFATLGVEDNNHGGTTNRAQRRLNYGHLFYRQEIDDRGSGKTQKLGWRTDTASRPIMIDDLAALIRDGFSCPSKETIEEMMSFVVKADGKAEADQSCFDDRIIASAIAVQVHKNFGISRYFPSAR